MENSKVLDLIPDIISEVNIKKEYTWLNKAGLDFFGEGAIGKAASNFFEGVQKTYDIVSPIFEGTKDKVYVESWQKRRDGEVRYLGWWCWGLKNDKGEITGALSYAHDITDEYVIKEKMRQSNAQLQNAMALAKLGAWELNPITNIFTFNDAFYALYHTTADQLKGYNLTADEYAKKFVYPEDIHVVADEIKKLNETNDSNYTSKVEHRILFPDGKMGYIMVRFFIIKNRSGQTVKVFGINQDITEQKQREIDLENAKKTLEENINKLEQFNRLMVDREMKMIELKEELEKLRNQK
jgi:PAS domain-containing protein